MSRFLQVMGAETFRLEVPSDAKVFIGPLVEDKPTPLPEGAKITNLYLQGYDRHDKVSMALHVHASDGSILAMIPDVRGFRDLDVNYTAKVASEEGTTVWKSDKDGYKREEQVRRAEDWVGDQRTLPAPTTKKRGR